MKRKAVIAPVALGLVLIGALTIWAATHSDMFSIGTKYPQAASDSALPSEVAAEYSGQKVTEEMVEYQLYIDASRPEETRMNYTRSDVINNLLLGYIILDEAREAGLSVGREEVQSTIAASKEAAAENAQAAAVIQDFCDGAGITEEEYWARLEEQMYDTLLRMKYENNFLDAYLAGHPGAGQEEAKAAYEQHRQELLRAHESEITYYGLSAS